MQPVDYLLLLFNLLGFTAQVLKVCKTPGPTDCFMVCYWPQTSSHPIYA